MTLKEFAERLNGTESGCQSNGTRVILLSDKKSVAVKKVKIYKYAGGYFKSAFN